MSGLTEEKLGQQVILEEEPRGILEDVVESIFTQGVNRGLMIVFNVIFTILILLFCAMLGLGGFNPHYAFLLIITIGLFASIHWFVSELNAAQAATNEKATNEEKKSN